MWPLRILHAEIFGEVVISTAGGATTGRCGCGVTNSYRAGFGLVEKWAIDHGNHLHEIDLASVITDPNGIAEARAWFGLVRGSRGEAAWQARCWPSRPPTLEAAERLLAWCEVNIIALGQGSADEEWLGWLVVLANRVISAAPRLVTESAVFPPASTSNAAAK